LYFLIIAILQLNEDDKEEIIDDNNNMTQILKSNSELNKLNESQDEITR